MRITCARSREDIAALRAQADIVVASCHWGLRKDVLAYMREIAHAAIDAGADIVIGHGPHYSLPVEAYRGKPIFYGLGSFSFHTGHGGRRHGDWIGMMAEIELKETNLSQAGCRFVRHNDRNETIVTAPADEPDAVAEISAASATLGSGFRWGKNVCRSTSRTVEPNNPRFAGSFRGRRSLGRGHSPKPR